MSTTDTPRTDEQKFGECCATNFARQLEREVAALRAELSGEALRLRAELAAAQTILAQWKEFLQEVEVAEDRSNLDGDSAEVVLEQLNDGAEAMLKLTPDSVRNELAAAREALIKLRDCDWIITLPDRMDAVREIARSALNAIDAPPCWATGVCAGFDATDRTLTVQLSQPLTSTSNANPSGWKLGGNIQIRAAIDAARAKEGKP